MGIPLSKNDVLQALSDRDVEILSAIYSYSFPLKKANSDLRFDVLPADQAMADLTDNWLIKQFKRNRLHRKLEAARQEYDYILIDSPPNWRHVSQLAI